MQARHWFFRTTQKLLLSHTAESSIMRQGESERAMRTEFDTVDSPHMVHTHKANRPCSVRIVNRMNEANTSLRGQPV
eukprot:4118692-Prymnesium_polylepis.1